MAKKKSANDFNMAQAINEVLTSNPNSTLSETLAALTTKHPSSKINKNSFSVAFYNGRKKLGIESSRRGKKAIGKGRSGGRLSMDLYALQTAAKFLSEVGGADAAIEAIKQVQALQVK